MKYLATAFSLLLALAGCTAKPSMVDLGKCPPGNMCVVSSGVGGEGGPVLKDIFVADEDGVPIFHHQAEGPGTLQTALPTIGAAALGAVGVAAGAYLYNPRPAKFIDNSEGGDITTSADGGDGGAGGSGGNSNATGGRATATGGNADATSDATATATAVSKNFTKNIRVRVAGRGHRPRPSY